METDNKLGITQFLEFLRDVCVKNNPVGFHYQGGPADLLLQHGQWYEPSSNGCTCNLAKTRRKTHLASCLLQRGEPKQCFYNASIRAMRHGLRYVEGYATSIIPVHHAWVLDASGKVLEVTWDKPGSAYFGIEFDPKHVIDWKRKSSDSILFNNHMELYTKPFEGKLCI